MTDDGCLGPWHAVLYEVVTGAMVRGPQGASFAPLAAPSRQRPRALKTFPVEGHGGAIWLVGERQSHPVGVVPRDEIQASTGV